MECWILQMGPTVPTATVSKGGWRWRQKSWKQSCSCSGLWRCLFKTLETLPASNFRPLGTSTSSSAACHPGVTSYFLMLIRGNGKATQSHICLFKYSPSTSCTSYSVMKYGRRYSPDAGPSTGTGPLGPGPSEPYPEGRKQEISFTS